MFEFTQISSLEKVMLRGNLPQKEFSRVSVLKNERFSYQIAFIARSEGGKRIENTDFKVSVNSPLAKFITLRTVEQVPSQFPAYEDDEDTDYISKTPGLFPDLLQPLARPFVQVVHNAYSSLWVTVGLDSFEAGVYPITLNFESSEGDTISKTLEVEIIDAVLPEQEMIFTQWFHADCVATAYDTKVFSKKHWEMLEKFIETASRNGVNMLLTPLFTPPLDTEVGSERPTVQLVDVKKVDEKYSFGFQKLGKWIDISQKNGIKYFEMSHLFTQWGAKAAPKIMAEVNGKMTRIFGWDTPASSEAYKEFLHAFLPKLTDYLKEKGIADKTYFHISDEPHGKEQLQNYLAAKALISEHLKDFIITDALSQLEFYKLGAIEHPVSVTATAEEFVNYGVENLWVYYSCVTGKGLCNRYISMPSYRNRAIGLQLYKYDIKGFLHWGYNFYYSQYSKEIINPFLITDAKLAFPSGDSFSVYPGKGGPLESIRLCVFFDALQDIRALKLLESYIGKEETVKFFEKFLNMTITFKSYPASSELLLELRNRINEKIKSFIV